MNKQAIGVSITLAICAAIFAIVMLANWIASNQNSFTDSEQLAAAHVLCEPHQGVTIDGFDFADMDHPARVVCNDGFISVVNDPNPDPDVGPDNPYQPGDSYWSPSW
jgi:hypothetical protein